MTESDRMNDEYISVNGIRTRFVRAGEQGHAVVLLHGLGASLESWARNVEPLGREFRVFAPDLIYFGKSDKPDREPTQTDFFEFTLGLLDALGLERAVLVGNSMGGAIAAKVAMLHPDRVSALILVNSAGFGREVAWWLRARTLFYPRLPGPPSPWIIRFGLRQIFEDPTRVPDELLQQFIQLDYDPDVRRSYQRVLGIGVDWRGLKPEMLAEIRDAAPGLRVPTLIVWGKQDRVVPVQHAHVAHTLIPAARLHVFDDCGHTPQLEYPAEFNALLTRFLRETLTPGPPPA